MAGQLLALLHQKLKYQLVLPTVFVSMLCRSEHPPPARQFSARRTVACSCSERPVPKLNLTASDDIHLSHPSIVSLFLQAELYLPKFIR